jgi:hypothetical protein
MQKFQNRKYKFYFEWTFSPGPCYELGLKVLQPQHMPRATWRPIGPGS